MDTKFEFVDEGPNGSKRWKIEAISVTTTRNNRKYTEQEMMLGARSLSFRPLDRNHDMTKILPFPQNQTEVMDFNPQKMTVEGTMLVADQQINELIRTGKINKLSIEQIPTKGESCSVDTNVCEQKGVVFTGLALLDYDVMPGDPSTKIMSESVKEIPLSEMLSCVQGCKCETCMLEKFEWTIEKDSKLTMDDISATYDSMNDSQKAHIIDPNDFYSNTKKFVKKGFNDLNEDQRKALIKTYGFRHSYNDVKHLLPDGEEVPNKPVFDNDLLGQEKALIAATKKLQDAGIKDPVAQSMAVQDPNNKTENNSLIITSQDNGRMITPNSKWTKEKRDALYSKLKSNEKLIKEIDSTISAFIGQQNNKAPLSDSLADVITNASDMDLDHMARITADQEPSVIPDGGLADYKQYTQEMAKAIASALAESNKSLMEEFATKLIPKQESVTTPSSQVSDPQFQAKEEMLKKTYEYYDIKGHPEYKEQRQFDYKLDVKEYMQKYGGHQASGATGMVQGLVQKNAKGETVTVSAGDMGQTFAKQVMLLPGGRMRVPVRQYCNFTEIPNGADRANWYTIGSFVFTTVTEGTEPTNVAQTVTKIQALPTLRGAVQRVGYTQVENAPFGLVDAINNAMVLAGLHDEALDLLGAGGSYWGTASNVTNWINGNTGADITSQNDDIAGMTLSRTGLIAAKQRIEKSGYDVSPGNLVLFLAPKAYQDLMLDTNLNTYYQYARPDITATYVLESLYGIDLVISTAVNQNTNTTNNTWRNTMAVKGWALGIAAAREITIEVQRRNEVQQLIISGMHRVKSAVIDYAASCGISSAQ